MRIVRYLLIVALACLYLPQAATALYLNDDVIPGKPITTGYASLGLPDDPNDVLRVYLVQGEELRVAISGPAGSDFDLILYGPDAVNFSAPELAKSAGPTSSEMITYIAAQEGWHYVRVQAWSPGPTSYLLAHFKTPPQYQGPSTSYRLWGSTRYATSVAIARANFPFWRNIDHVIIACGEDRAAADPLAAAGLVWTYGAPILLVRSDSVPAEVLQALADIRGNNGPFTLHIVGGPVSVSQSVVDEIVSHVPNVTADRIAPYGNRYELAASIAYRMAQERPGESLGVQAGGAALLANGEDPAKFFDALALSPIAASGGFPILLVKHDSIPAATSNALSFLSLSKRYVGGGPNTVSDGVLQELGAGTPEAERWAGRDRYETATEIMRASFGTFAAPPVVPISTIVVAKLPDALSGGAFVGLRGGCLVLTRTDALPSASRTFLHDIILSLRDCAILGGPNSVSSDTMSSIDAALVP